jgi:hypothetical protein
MSCGCKNKANQQQAQQSQVQTQQANTNTAQNNTNVQESVKKVIQKYYRR